MPTTVGFCIELLAADGMKPSKLKDYFILAVFDQSKFAEIPCIIIRKSQKHRDTPYIVFRAEQNMSNFWRNKLI